MGYYIIVFELIIGFLAGLKAREKNRNPYLWFFIGFFLSILGLLLVFFVPSKAPAYERMDEDEE